MKKLLSLVLSILLLLSLPSCRKDEEPPVQTDATVSRFADTNIDDRYYMGINDMHAGFVYGSDFYYKGSNCALFVVPLPMGGQTETRQEGKPLCSDPMCSHMLVECPAMMRDPQSIFVLDSAESNGEQPVIYYSRCTAGNIAFDNAWESGQGYEVVRFDAAANQIESITSVNYPIMQLMTYQDRVYFLTQTASKQFEINTVKKSGGEVTTLSPGDSYLNLIGANHEGVYVNDEKGNVYLLDHTLESEELIYTVGEVYPIQSNYPAELDMFVEDEHLYFYADFEILHYLYDPHDPDEVHESFDYDFIKHSLRRVKLDDPMEESELVAAEVFQGAVYGVYNGVLYYGPFDVTTGIRTGTNRQMDVNNHCSSGGTIRGVDLETFETFDVITDCGYNIEVSPYYVNDRCIITVVFPYRNGMGISYSTSGSFPSLLDFETGALYNAYNAVRLYDGTIND